MKVIVRITLVLVSMVAMSSACRMARAAQYCVSSQNTLQAALNAAATNGEDDVIYVVAGTYTLTAELTYGSTEPHALVLYGGVDATCQNLTGGFSVLNGNNQVRPLQIDNNSGDIFIERFIFEEGLEPAYIFDLGGGGLDVESTTGDINITLNQFIGNHSDGFSGGFSASTSSGTLRIRNNLVFANSAADFGGAALFQDAGEAYVTGNTVVANSVADGSNFGGLVISGNAHFTVSNNILWNNNAHAAYDFDAASTHTRLTNDIGIAAGTSPDTKSGELGVDPGFRQCGFLCFSFELADSSLLRNAGTDAPPGGATSIDLAFKPRLQGAHVDIGAYENDTIFADDFE